MDRHLLSAMPDEDFDSLIQHHYPGNAHETFAIFHARWSDMLERRCHVLHPNDPDAVDDVLSKTWIKIWIALSESKFTYMGVKECQNWLFTILQHTSASHWREENRLREKCPFYLQQPRPLKDGTIVEFGATIPSEEEVADGIEREEFVEQCLHKGMELGLNDDQLELLEGTLRGEVHPSDWAQDEKLRDRVYQNRHRMRRKFKAEIRRISKR